MILQELFEAGPGGSDNYAENLAQQVFNVRPNLRSEDDVLNIGYKVAVQDLASQTRAMSLFSRDQDFPSDFVSAYYYLQKQKPGDQGLNEFAPGAGGGDDGDADPYRYPKPESYRRSADYFGQFEADHFDREDFDDATGVFKGYWDNTQIAYFKFDTPAKTGSDDSGMGWYYEPDSDNGADTSANPAVDNSAQRKQQELSMIDAFLKSGQTPKPGSQIYGLMKRHGILENSLNEFAPGSDGGESGHWYTDDELADIIGDDWFEDFDVSNDGFNIDAYGEKAKKNLVGHANAWFDDRGYNVNVLGVEHNDVDHDLKWYIVGSFQNDNFAKKDVPENSYKNSQAYRADGGANDEDHEGDARRDQQEKSGTWYIRLNGKLIKDKQGNPYSFRGKAAANKAALTMQAKLFNQGKEFMLTTNPNDKPQGVAEESSENKYANLSNRGVNRGIKRAGDDFNRLLDLDQAESPHYKTQHQQDTKQRLKTKPMAGPKGVLPEQGVAEGQGRDKHYYLRNDIWRVMDGDELVHEYTPERYEVVGAKKLLARFDDEGYDVTHVISPMGTVTYLYGKPEMDEGFDGEYDDEAGMADNNLETLKRAVQGIDDVIQAGDNLPEWCQEKIAVSKSMLVSVWDYMRSEKEKN